MARAGAAAAIAFMRASCRSSVKVQRARMARGLRASGPAPRPQASGWPAATDRSPFLTQFGSRWEPLHRTLVDLIRSRFIIAWLRGGRRCSLGRVRRCRGRAALAPRSRRVAARCRPLPVAAAGTAGKRQRFAEQLGLGRRRDFKCFGKFRRVLADFLVNHHGKIQRQLRGSVAATAVNPRAVRKGKRSWPHGRDIEQHRRVRRRPGASRRASAAPAHRVSSSVNRLRTGF